MHRTTILVALALFILINGIFFAKPLFKTESQQDTDDVVAITQSYKLSEYQTIIRDIQVDDILSPQDLLKGVVSFMKLGYYDEAKLLIQNNSDYSSTVTKLYKILVLREKEDWQGILDVTEKYRSTDEKMRSLYLQLRAEAFSELGNRDAAVTLAEDSFSLDPLAPASLLIQAIDYRLGDKHRDALNLFARAENLGIKSSPRALYEKGISLFYTRQREEMKASFSQIINHNDYGGAINMYLGRDALENNNYRGALLLFEKAGEYSPTKWDWKLWIARTYMAEEDYEHALEWYQKIYDENLRNVELLTDMMVLYNILDDAKQVYTLSLEVQQVVGENAGANSVLLRTLLEVGLITDAGEYAQQIKEFAAQENHEALHDWIVRAYIYNLVLAIQQQQDYTSRYQALLNYHGSNIVDRSVYLSLMLSEQHDEVGALRALQAFKPTATMRDVQTIAVLHYLLIKDPIAAARVLSELTKKKPLDLDYLWFKWKLSRMAGDGAASLTNKTQEALLLLKNVSKAEAEDMEGAFELYFDGWLKYMKRYYE